MMKKVFFSLLFLVAVGAGILWWLMQALPGTKSAEHGALEPKEVKVDDNLSHDVPAAVANEHGGTDEHGAALAAKASEHAASNVLTITTDPVVAKVKVDGVEKGKTPFELALTGKSQKIELLAEGFEEHQKEAPSLEDLEGDNVVLNWQIKLKAKKGSLERPPHAAAPLAPKALPASTLKGAEKLEHSGPTVSKGRRPLPMPKVDQDFIQGAMGPTFIQVKSMPVASADEATAIRTELGELREKLGSLHVKVRGCLVQIPTKGHFVRILVGPFANKSFAKEKEAAVQNSFEEKIIIAGAQQCLPISSL